MQPSDLFSVPGALDWWWDLMVPITAALYWPAWAAIFTFAALWNTARLADRANRQDYRRESAHIRAAAVALSRLARIFKVLDDADATDLRKCEVEVASSIGAYASISGDKYIDGFDISRMTTAEAIDAFLRGRAAVHTLHARYQRYDAGTEKYEAARVVQFKGHIIAAAKQMHACAAVLDARADHPLSAKSLKALMSQLGIAAASLRFKRSRQGPSDETTA